MGVPNISYNLLGDISRISREYIRRAIWSLLEQSIISGMLIKTATCDQGTDNIFTERHSLIEIIARQYCRKTSMDGILLFERPGHPSVRSVDGCAERTLILASTCNVLVHRCFPESKQWSDWVTGISPKWLRGPSRLVRPQRTVCCVPLPLHYEPDCRRPSQQHVHGTLSFIGFSNQ